jgi:hypothetical protein
VRMGDLWNWLLVVSSVWFGSRAVERSGSAIRKAVNLLV